ncbi:MAG: hypothetical protein IPP71_17175 [Bacteroidetes bacterium]|nr:hypothetical protein [Bacteroidota bacterium]
MKICSLTLHKVLIFFSIILFPSMLTAQQSLLDEVEKGSKTEEKDYVVATFKSTRNINFHTLEVVPKRTLDFRISHRFGEFSSGSYNAYGIDGPANIRLGLEYSYDGRLMGGLGRSSYQKQYDGFLKYRLLRQTTDGKMPVSVTLFTSIYYTNLKDPNKSSTGIDKYEFFSSRLSFVHQIIVGRKFTSAFSMQLAPVMVHYNLVDEFTDLNDMYLLAIAGRLKVSNRIAITAEYAYNFIEYSKRKTYYNPLGIGIDIETGGHVFQLHVTNSFGITDNQFYPYTTTSWRKNGIRLGFNVSRVFTI